jgi:hypothetical protein
VLAAKGDTGATGSTGATGAGYGGSSTTSFAVGTGSKAFTTQAGLAYQVGNYVRAASAAGGANFMEGAVTAYSGTTLTINVTKTGGSGTHTDWNFSVSGVPGAGDILSTNNGGDFANADTTLANLHGLSFGASQSLTPSQQQQARQNAGVPAVGQCRLTKSGSNLLLSPLGGNLLTINGVQCIVPAAGVTLAPTGLTAGTAYFIYAFMSSGTMTLEASTTGHVTDTSAGNKGAEIKSGDSARTLVGMAQIVSGPAWADTLTQRFVISWFNRRAIPLQQTGRVDTGTTIGSGLGDRTGSNHCEFLTWADEAVTAKSNAVVRNASAASMGSAVNFDGVTTGPQKFVDVGATSTDSDNSVDFVTTLSEGSHYLTWFGSASAGSGRAFVSNMAVIRG